MAGVGADVPSLVVRVDGEIEPHQFREIIVVAQHRGEVGGPVLVRIDAANLSVAVEIAVDGSSERGQLGYQVHGILIHIL